MYYCVYPCPPVWCGASWYEKTLAPRASSRVRDSSAWVGMRGRRRVIGLGKSMTRHTRVRRVWLEPRRIVCHWPSRRKDLLRPASCKISLFLVWSYFRVREQGVARVGQGWLGLRAPRVLIAWAATWKLECPALPIPGVPHGIQGRVAADDGHVTLWREGGGGGGCHRDGRTG